jgi:hypothetical protein
MKAPHSGHTNERQINQLHAFKNQRKEGERELKRKGIDRGRSEEEGQQTEPEDTSRCSPAMVFLWAMPWSESTIT